MLAFRKFHAGQMRRPPCRSRPCFRPASTGPSLCRWPDCWIRNDRPCWSPCWRVSASFRPTLCGYVSLADCQRLAEALRPAVELFEAVAPEESRTLPSYGGRLRSTAAPLPWESTLAEALPVVARPEVARSPVPQRQSLLAAFLSGSCPMS